MSEPMNPYDSPEPVKQGMSGTTKVLLALGIGFVLVIVVCCGIFGIGGYWAYNLAKDSTSTEPETIRRVTNEIVTIDIPESFEPQFSMDFKIPFNEGAMQMVVYQDQAVRGAITLFQFTNEAMANDPNMRQRFDNSMARNKQYQREHIQIEKAEKFETTINGEPARFTIAQGTSDKAEAEFWEVTGDFHGKRGFAQFTLQAKSPDFTKEQVLEILKSMK